MNIDEIRHILIERKNVINLSEVERITSVSRKKLSSFINGESSLNIEEYNSLSAFITSFFKIEVKNEQL